MSDDWFKSYRFLKNGKKSQVLYQYLVNICSKFKNLRLYIYENWIFHYLTPKKYSKDILFPLKTHFHPWEGNKNSLTSGIPSLQFNLWRNGKERDVNFLINVSSQSGAKNDNFQPIKLATHVHHEVISTLFAITPQVELEWRLQGALGKSFRSTLMHCFIVCFYVAFLLWYVLHIKCLWKVLPAILSQESWSCFNI